MQQLYQTIIGIEIHAQLSIPTKLFSSAPTRHESHDNKKSTSSPSSTTAIPSNTNVHPFDIAYPGTLPTLSHSAIKASILSAASLNCRTIHHYSKFERKHYFYADLPQGYQITQQRWPLASEGLGRMVTRRREEEDERIVPINKRMIHPIINNNNNIQLNLFN
jgi:aspartyl-tRNA(Asn)/glutamyl-tRNA(Gln) amidotransferase subunit B